MRIDYDAQIARIGSHELREGDVITIDGASGRVMQGRVPTLEPELSGDFGTVMAWAANTSACRCAPMPKQSRKPSARGALARRYRPVPHRAYVFNPARILQVRRMILAQSGPQRDAALVGLSLNSVPILPVCYR